MAYADLHVHTTASDGAFSPAEIVEKAKAAGLSCVAITDHDRVEGIAEALDAGERLSMKVIPGVELSTLTQNEEKVREFHILGYFIDWKDESLISFLNEIVDSRKNRAVRMVEKLNALGYDIAITRVRQIADGAFIGRPHIAQALLEKGYVSNTADAFSDDLIGKGGKAYAERMKVTPKEAIDRIVDLGGVPVLAHPGFLPDRTVCTREEIDYLIQHGIKGIETEYSMHTPEQIDEYTALARENDLLITGGTDFHGGATFPDIHIGSTGVDEAAIEALEAASSRRGQA